MRMGVLALPLSLATALRPYTLLGQHRRAGPGPEAVGEAATTVSWPYHCGVPGVMPSSPCVSWESWPWSPMREGELALSLTGCSTQESRPYALYLTWATQSSWP